MDLALPKFSVLGKHLLEVLFPPLCLHCGDKTAHSTKLLCASCVSLLHFLEKRGRCPYCFTRLENSSKCEACRKGGRSLQLMAATFEHIGPAACLVHAFKYAGRGDLAPDLAAWMVAQLVRLKWPFPDLVVPVPQSLSHFLSRGYNQSLLLAEEIGRFIERPIKDVLQRKSGGFSQSALNKTQREKLSQELFAWKCPYDVSDKTLLLIDDVLTTGRTLRCCAEVLREGFPKKVYCLTFSRA